MRKEKHVLYEDHVLVVERHPRRKFPILTISALVAVFILIGYLSKNDLALKTITDATLTTQNIFAEEKLNEVTDAASIHYLVANAPVDEIKRQIVSIDRESINAVVDGMTPIMLAASSGNVELIDLLFTQGADPNLRGSMQRTALQYASEKNHIEAAKRLLAYGADIDAYDDGRLTPLIMAANRGYTELALLFTAKGADVNIQHVEGWTALIDAVIKDDAMLVNALLKAGANKDLATSNGMKAIDYARQYGHENMVKILGK